MFKSEVFTVSVGKLKKFTSRKPCLRQFEIFLVSGFLVFKLRLGERG